MTQTAAAPGQTSLTPAAPTAPQVSTVVSPAAPSGPAGALPSGIEIFRAGTHRDSAGRVHTFSAEQLAEMATSYNRALREAPLTVGHPKDNLPAYGWVKRVFINEAGNLAIDPDQVDPAFAEMVRAGRFKKRSASFYPPNAPHNPTPGKWYLRHVAFLGAQPPAVPGLKDIGFAELGDAAEAVSFSETASAPAPADTPTQDKELPMSDADKSELERLRAQAKANEKALADAQAQLQAATQAADAAKKQAASFAEKAAQERRNGFASFAEAEIKAGRLLPKDKNLAIATLETLAAAEQPLSFAEGDTTTQVTAMQMCAWLQGQMSSRNPTVNFGEMAGGALKTSGFDARGKSDEEVHKAALAYQHEHPEVSYAQALGHVTSFDE